MMGRSSYGRALASHARGTGFDSPRPPHLSICNLFSFSSVSLSFCNLFSFSSVSEDHL